jgi:hypothetical protein
VAERDGTVLSGAGGVTLAGHAAAGDAPAHVVVLRTGELALFRGTAASPRRWWRSPLLSDAEPVHDAAACATAAGVHHGVNRHSLLVACAAGGPVARAGLAGALLACAADVDEAARLLEEAVPGLEAPDRVWLAGPDRSLAVDVDGAGMRAAMTPAPSHEAAGLAGMREALRARVPGAAVSAIAASLSPAGPELLVCLGPPAAGVFIRQWPGIPAPPPLDAGDAPAPLGVLAASLLAVRDRDGAAALAAAEAAALAEGEEAERQARMMDAAGDDHGAEVRRAVAQAHATELAVTAMRRLLLESRGSRSHPIIG